MINLRSLRRFTRQLDTFKFTLTDLSDKKYEVTALEGENMINAGIANKVPFQKACGGNAECTTCHVHIPREIQMNQEYIDAEEKELDSLEFSEGNNENSRLACQITLKRSVYEGADIKFLDMS